MGLNRLSLRGWSAGPAASAHPEAVCGAHLPKPAARHWDRLLLAGRHGGRPGRESFEGYFLRDRCSCRWSSGGEMRAVGGVRAVDFSHCWWGPCPLGCGRWRGCGTRSPLRSSAVPRPEPRSLSNSISKGAALPAPLWPVLLGHGRCALSLAALSSSRAEFRACSQPVPPPGCAVPRP